MDMKEDGKCVSNTVIDMERIQRIFKERDTVYQERETILEKKNAAVSSLAEKVCQEQKQLQESRKNVEEAMKQMEQRQKELEEWEAQLQEREQAITEKEKEITREQKEIILQEQLQLEEIKTQKLQLQKDREFLEGEKISREMGIPVMDFDGVHKYEGEIKELRQIISDLQEERSRLLQEIFGSAAKAGEGRNPEKENRPILDTAEETMEPGYDIESGITEELTAEVMKCFLEKNGQGVEGIAIAHSDQADQLLAHKGTLVWRFIFDDPCYFDVSAKRKEDRKLHKTLARLNQEHPELKFSYVGDSVIATGFFTKNMRPYDLIEEVKRVSGFFRE